MKQYDIIGDIHGHAAELKELLLNLGYKRSGYGFRHNERKIVFVGDFIDRGPANAEVIQIARAIVEDGNGYAVMGNHEYNAIAFHTRRPESTEFFRDRTEKNREQHQETLDQLSNQEMRDAILWFKTLPVAIEFDDFRVAHASWQTRDIQSIETGFATLGRFTTDFMASACDPTNPLCRAIENILKGPELQLPKGHSFFDKGGHQRFSTRVRWYTDSTGMTLQDYSIGAGDNLPEGGVPNDPKLKIDHYLPAERPVFFGHYWLQGIPMPFASNVACVDYSVAKEGKLCAYQWRPGETILNANRYAWVDAKA